MYTHTPYNRVRMYTTHRYMSCHAEIPDHICGSPRHMYVRSIYATFADAVPYISALSLTCVIYYTYVYVHTHTHWYTDAHTFASPVCILTSWHVHPRQASTLVLHLRVDDPAYRVPVRWSNKPRFMPGCGIGARDRRDAWPGTKWRGDGKIDERTLYLLIGWRE